MAKRAGKYGKVMVGGQQLSVSKWSCKDMIGEGDVTQTTDLGKGSSLGLIERLEFSVEATWDSSASPYLNPPAITKGENGPGFQLYTNKDDANPLYTMPVTFIADVSVDAPVDGVVKYTITGKSQGGFVVAGS